MAIAELNWRTLSFWQRTEQVPPILVRLLARQPRQPTMTTQQVAERSGLPAAQVVAIASQLDWTGVDMPAARAFMQGCGVDLADPKHVRRLRDYFRWAAKRPPHTRFGFIRRSDDHDGYLDELWRRWREHLKR